MVSARSSHPLAAFTLVLAALIASLLACGVAPGAQAATIATSATGFTAGPVLAPDGRVVIGEHRGSGAVRVLAIDPRTGSAAQLAAFPPLADGRAFTQLNLAGSGAIVTATVGVFGRGSGAGALIPRKLMSRVMTILPTLSTLALCAPATSQLGEIAAAGDGFVAIVGEGCAQTRSAVRVRTPQGAYTIPTILGPDDRPDFGVDISDLRATGPMLAWVEMRLPVSGPGPRTTLVIARGATGEILLRTPVDAFPLALGLGADGTVALPSFANCNIRVVAPATPGPRDLPLPAGLCPQPSGAAVVAGGRIVYPTFGGYAVTGGAGSAQFLRDTAGSRSALAFDGTTAYVTRVDCDADRLVSVDPGVDGSPPPLPLPTLRSCPMRRASPSRLSSTPSGRVSIGLRCPAGCRGTLRLVQQRRGGRERRVGSVDYVSGAGRFVVRPRIAAYARALAGCPGGLRVNAVLFPAADDRTVAATGKGLGAYRISSRSRCRRTGGPAFRAPAPGPRP